MPDERRDPDAQQSPTADTTVHDEHPVEPAEGAREPGEAARTDQREHPTEPAEGAPDAATS